MTIQVAPACGRHRRKAAARCGETAGEGAPAPHPPPAAGRPLDKAPDFSLGRAEGGASGTIRVPARLVAAGAPLTLQVAQRHAGRARGGARGPRGAPAGAARLLTVSLAVWL